MVQTGSIALAHLTKVHLWGPAPLKVLGKTSRICLLSTFFFTIILSHISEFKDKRVCILCFRRRKQKEVQRRLNGEDAKNHTRQVLQQCV